MDWLPIDTAPKDGPFTAWCRWYMVPIETRTTTSARPYWTDWAPRWAWMHNGMVHGTGDQLYVVKQVEATHWQPLPKPPSP